jgi:hypothetical protein
MEKNCFRQMCEEHGLDPDIYDVIHKLSSVPKKKSEFDDTMIFIPIRKEDIKVQ